MYRYPVLKWVAVVWHGWGGSRILTPAIDDTWHARWPGDPHVPVLSFLHGVSYLALNSLIIYVYISGYFILVIPKVCFCMFRYGFNAILWYMWFTNIVPFPILFMFHMHCTLSEITNKLCAINQYIFALLITVLESIITDLFHSTDRGIFSRSLSYWDDVWSSGSSSGNFISSKLYKT